MDKIIMIKYGELTTKGDNRGTFIKLLEQNILSALSDYRINVIYDYSRMYIECENLDENLINKVKNIFGIHSIVVCKRINSNDIEEIKSESLKLIAEKEFKTFKVETKRSNKKFEISSMDFSRMLGAHILKNTDSKVDVHNPDVTLNVEIRKDLTLIYTDEIKAVGGYPVGVQGKGLLMISGGIDSPVAGYLSLKRGISLECLYFEAIPHTSLEAREKVKKLLSILNEYSGNIKLYVVPFTKIQEEIYKNCDPTYNITILRRMMYRIAERFAHKKNCKIIINGENVGQVASQTLSSISVVNNVVRMPIIRPVVCYDKLEIIDLAKKINTYETSILPYEDCCTIFVPKHPVINPSLEKCELEEAKIDYQPLINECLKNIFKVELKDNYNEYL
ncbi:MAG: tRNA 4-thiouridine(8) synthase ThiI [Bacilli bacterium]|nr:tRNA 4-thiouridine(8) synthase ThiI [Bacilli bacterium]